MSRLTDTLAAALALGVAAPLTAQNPSIRRFDGSTLTLDVPVAQTILVFAVSVNGDVRLVFPAAGDRHIVSEGRQQLTVTNGPWLAGGDRTAFVASSTAPTLYCAEDVSMNFQLSEMRSGVAATRHCTWMPSSPDVDVTEPRPSYLVIVGTDPVRQPLTLDDAFRRLKLRGKGQEMADSIAARLTALDSTRVWWGVGKAWKRY